MIFNAVIAKTSLGTTNGSRSGMVPHSCPTLRPSYLLIDQFWMQPASRGGSMTLGGWAFFSQGQFQERDSTKSCQPPTLSVAGRVRTSVLKESGVVYCIILYTIFYLDPVSSLTTLQKKGGGIQKSLILISSPLYPITSLQITILSL